MSCETCTLDCPHKKGIHYDVWGEGIECQNTEEELPYGKWKGDVVNESQEI